VDEYSTLLDSLKGDNIKDVAKACIVVWCDIWDHTETWVDFPLTETDDTEPIVMNTMGYLVHATDKAVVVAGTVDFKHNQMSQVCVIPKGCIVAINVL
jgi:hypothetical protein